MELITLRRNSDDKIDLIINNTVNRLFSDTAQSGTFTIRNLGYMEVGGDQYFNGKMSNFRAYNRALSAEEVKLLYEKGRH